MSDSVGFGSLTWLIIIALALAGVAFALYRWRARSDGGAADREDFLDEAESEGRLEVLESTPVDAQRRLVLVRCDNVEHLIMVGGPADLVVESDVRKSRAAAKGMARPATEPTGRALAAPAERAVPDRAEILPPRRSEPAPLAPEAQARPESRPAEQKPLPQTAPEPRAPQAAAAERRADEPKLSDAKPAEPRPEAPPRLSAPSRPTLTAVPGAAIQPPGSRKDQSGGAALPPGARDGRNGEAAGRPSVPELPVGGRREPQFPNSRRAPSVQPAPANANRSDERGRPQPAISREVPAAERRPNGGMERGAHPSAASLPPAEVPWHEPDTVEDEIGRALATESNGPQAGAQNGAPTQPGPVGGKSDPATTLGDLAERLEEALAREVQSANKGRSRVDPNVDTFSFDPEAAEKPTPEQRQGSAQPERREPPKVMAPAPEPEVRREARPQPERQEEAPVISLHGRRREAVDPLEDEMARLLGELTGDTNRR